MSAALAANSLSVLTHQERCRCKQMPSLRNTRQTACTEPFTSLATAGPSQVAWPAGAGCSKTAKTRFRNTWSYLRWAPGRGASRKPLNPWLVNRRRHLITVFGRVWHWRATSCTRLPAKHPRMIRARSTICLDPVRLQANRSNSCRSSGPQLIVGAFLAMCRIIQYIVYHCK
jgi:hypothetical protein